jgi:hypothetical protein
MKLLSMQFFETPSISDLFDPYIHTPQYLVLKKYEIHTEKRYIIQMAKNFSYTFRERLGTFNKSFNI